MKNKNIMLVLVICVFLFMAGFHQIDNAYNMKTMTLMMAQNGIDMKIHDRAILFSWNMDELYMSGFFMIMISIAILAGLILEQNEDVIIIKNRYISGHH